MCVAYSTIIRKSGIQESNQIEKKERKRRFYADFMYSNFQKLLQIHTTVTINHEARKKVWMIKTYLVEKY